MKVLIHGRGNACHPLAYISDYFQTHNLPFNLINRISALICLAAAGYVPVLIQWANQKVFKK